MTITRTHQGLWMVARDADGLGPTFPTREEARDYRRELAALEADALQRQRDDYERWLNNGEGYGND